MQEKAFEAAMLDVAKAYGSPAQLLADDDLTRAQKLKLLQQWDYDLGLLLVAAEENMTGPGASVTAERMRSVRDAIKRLGVIPSLFPMHTFYWGDWHRDHTVGPELADNISPTGWAVKRGMIFATHHDAPVAFPDSMRVLSATVTRRSRSYSSLFCASSRLVGTPAGSGSS